MSKYTGTSATLLWLKARETTPGFWKLEEESGSTVLLAREIKKRADALARYCCAAMGHEVGARSDVGEHVYYANNATRFVYRYYCSRCREQFIFEPELYKL